MVLVRTMVRCCGVEELMTWIHMLKLGEAGCSLSLISIYIYIYTLSIVYWLQSIGASYFLLIFKINRKYWFCFWIFYWFWFLKKCQKVDFFYWFCRCFFCLIKINRKSHEKSPKKLKFPSIESCFCSSSAVEPLQKAPFKTLCKKGVGHVPWQRGPSPLF